MFKNLKDIIDKQIGKQKSFKSQKKAPEAPNAFDFIELIKQWELVVGPMVHKHTRPLRLKKNKLIVVSDHPAFSHQLSFLKDDILKKIRAHFPALISLKEIQFETNAQMFQGQCKLVKPTAASIQSKKPDIHPLSPKYIEYKKQAVKAVEENYGDSEFKEEFVQIYLNILLREDSV